ncbi:MAG: hypothetical protein E7638_08785 [Ruminococcaceae bacterium]|nr:hypothetical protein [Oscillospiraceae bacterium]
MNNSEREIVETNKKEDNIMTKVNWRQKLSSRKLWAAVLAAVFAVVTASFGDSLSAETVDVLKTGIYGLIAYIFGEGVVDAARAITK